MDMDAPTEGKRARRVNAQLNLVPYIDLLTCMVAFLLITAVWTQLARLQVASAGKGSDDDRVDPVMAPPMVSLHDEGLAVTWADVHEPLPKVDGDYDYVALSRLLARAKASMPDRNDALLVPADAITFDNIVRTMDVMIAAEFPLVSLQDVQ